ncbi:hypothetical protein [Flavisolibacter tropicus]|uniref:Uncharacterized protein n=1 Tax=Flavisolibacter tropicus TaxID=1492898 RepID=A0A172TWB8_9BACT|nr:hypothetical protein [Flavisolibacter tropicus]ANE51375.1 hypothetical protein SY85_13525 [Flavisolibacter tropicus]
MNKGICSILILVAILGEACKNQTIGGDNKYKKSKVDSSIIVQSSDDENYSDSIAIYFTSIASDSSYSLSIKTYSESKKLKQYPCVIKQELVFKVQDSVISKKLVPLSNVLVENDKRRFLKYVINGVAIDSINEQKIYMLYLYAANGEAENYYYYDMKGKLLFSQNCNKTGCKVEAFNFDKKAAIDYTNHSNDLKIKNIEGICIY